jgi:two-component system OmpR family response regulator
MRNMESILCVDDDPDICEVAKAALSLIGGLDVHTAGSGEQAIDLAYQWRPDLVLMDVMMPDLDGPSTLKRMRGHALLANIPVIFLTAKTLPAEVSHFLHLGALGVIRKPFDPMKLCDELLALWSPSAIAQEARATQGAQSKVQSQVGSLMGSFLERTKRDVTRLRAMIERARHEDPSVLQEAGSIAHSIHGAGAMFGCLEVSAASGAIESLIARVMTGAAVRGSVWESSLLEQLADSAHRLARLVNASGPSPNSVGMFAGGAAVDRIESSSQSWGSAERSFR